MQPSPLMTNLRDFFKNANTCKQREKILAHLTFFSINQVKLSAKYYVLKSGRVPCLCSLQISKCISIIWLDYCNSATLNLSTFRTTYWTSFKELRIIMLLLSSASKKMTMVYLSFENYAYCQFGLTLITRSLKKIPSELSQACAAAG